MKNVEKTDFQCDDSMKKYLPGSINRLKTPTRSVYRNVEHEYETINAQTLTEANQNRLIRDKIFAEFNRYCDVLPFRENIVNLDDCDTVHLGNYINANFIGHPFRIGDKSFIASQAPMRNTMESFCRMIIKHKIEILITIINKKEDPHRYFNYWCTSQTYVNHKIVVKNSIQSGNFVRLSTLLFVDEQNHVEQCVSHFHIFNWQDYCALSKNHLSEFVALLRYLLKRKEITKSPIVAHCSAGIGRSLTFICSYYLMEQNTTAKNQEEIKKYSVKGLVNGFREQRYNAINTLKQYKFLYEVVHFLQEELE